MANGEVVTDEDGAHGPRQLRSLEYTDRTADASVRAHRWSAEVTTLS